MENIKSIWFDFGRVLLPLDLEKTREAFIELGAGPDLEENTELFHSWERGEINRHEFYQGLKKELKGFASIPSIRQAWNAMLLDFPRAHFKYLQQLKEDYQLFLVSNTNSVHIESIKQNMGVFRYHQFLNLFDEVFYSFEMGVRKPEDKFFQMAAKKANAPLEECLLIDDNEENIKAAESLGMKTWHFNPDEDTLNFEKLKMAH
ncbi:MAG: HAD family phosphatase [Schleiferiaceae bacterium]|jgi:putative hydrolase of the HAD superfamily|nr:HAD family phosphatase [Schleiferiaceae bacterium]